MIWTLNPTPDWLAAAAGEEELRGRLELLLPVVFLLVTVVYTLFLHLGGSTAEA